MKRRDFIRNGKNFAVGALLSSVSLKSFSNDGKVYLNYTQQELDSAYTQADWAPNLNQVLAGQASAGDKVRSKYPPKTVAYGEKASEKLDIFSPPGSTTGRPVMIFIHGGAWKAMTKESVSFVAPTFVENGVVFAAPDFDNIPNNTLPGMADQCRRVILWVWKNAKELGVDPNRIYIGGHSSGAHLAAVMLTTDWTRFGAPNDLLKGGLVISGMCDLEPVLKSVRGSYVKLSDKDRIDLSPLFALHSVKCPVIVAWGGNESPEFKRQSTLMAEKLRAVGRLAGTFTLRETNHFEMLGVIGNEQSHLAQATLALIGR